MAIGALAIILGALWTLQGLGILADSKMSDQDIWAIIGAVVTVFGLILVVIGARVRSRSKRQ